MSLGAVSVAVFWGVLSLFALSGVARLEHLWGWWRSQAPATPGCKEWPLVTVQLPLYNERDVVERILEACSRLDYPEGRWSIQVLDDSTDDTSDRVSRALLDLQNDGLEVAHVRRARRDGFKAGALQGGLQEVRGDLVAVLDADFVPEPDFLKRLVPHFTGSVSMVQARWVYLNEGEGWLTRAQAVLLDGHFVVEQAARARLGRWFNFNGTAGVWSRAAIERAGGWSGDTLTEDLDLSYRAQMKGCRFVYVSDYGVPCELPADMNAFKTQQSRWAKGSVQTLRKLLWQGLSSGASFDVKREATTHLAGHLFHPLSVILALCLPLAMRARHAHPTSLGGWEPWVLAFAWLPFLFFYGLAGWHGVSEKRWERLAAVPLALALGLGLGLSQSRAVWEGFSREVGTFERTPKTGGRSASSYGLTGGRLGIMEYGMSLYLSGACGVAVALKLWWGLPFLILYAWGYAWVSLSGRIGRDK